MNASRLTDSVDPDYEAMCTLVGMMTMTWAWAESALAITIETIDGIGGHVPKGHERGLPVSLKNRLDYLKRAMLNIAVLEPIRERGLALAQHFADLKEDRHALTHGAAAQHRGEVFNVRLITTKGRRNTHSEKQVSVQDAIALNERLNALAVEAEDVARQVARSYGLPV